MKNVLVTGAAGFLGSRVVNILRDSYRVYSLDRKQPAEGVAQSVYCDITNRQSITESLDQFHIDYVVHCAALAHFNGRPVSDEQVYRTNSEATANLLSYFRARGGLRVFVFVSTVAVYGESEYVAQVTEESPVAPVSVYGKSKALAEHFCQRADDVPWVILRFPPIYDALHIQDIKKRVYRLKDLVRFRIGDGRQLYSFCSCDNAAMSIKWVLDNHELVRGTIMNVTDCSSYSWNELAVALEPIVGKRPTIVVPSFLASTMAMLVKRLPSDIGRRMFGAYWKLAKDNVYSAERIRSLGFEPHTRLSDVLTVYGANEQL